MASETNFFSFTTKDKKGEPYPLSQHKGKVVLVVNTASKCGFTGQLQGLETLYKSITSKHPDDFVILAFPCNQFNKQDPGSNDEIQSFCQLNYGVTFPVLGKTNVNDEGAEEVWTWMKKNSSRSSWIPMEKVMWNFEKFLIRRDGSVAGRWRSVSKPEGMEKAILEEIKKPKGE